MVTEEVSLVVGGHRWRLLTRDTATASAGMRWPSPSPEPKVPRSNRGWRTDLRVGSPSSACGRLGGLRIESRLVHLTPRGFTFGGLRTPRVTAATRMVQYAARTDGSRRMRMVIRCYRRKGPTASDLSPPARRRAPPEPCGPADRG